MRQNEVGRKLYVDVGESIIDSTYFEILLDSPVPSEREIHITPRDGVIMATEDLLIDAEPVTNDAGDQIFLANQYLSYVTRSCDIKHDGLYRIRAYVEFDNGLNAFYGPWVEFVVGE